MTDETRRPDPPDPADRPLGLAELLEEEPGEGFLDRVLRAIDRRRLGGEAATLSWFGLTAVVREYLTVLFEVFRGQSPTKGEDDAD